jgi:hypothetical protein
VTFFGQTVTAMNVQLALVDTEFMVIPEYLGVVVHSYDGWRVMAP